jgi:hypothetical protein
VGPLNRYGWWKRQDGATCHQLADAMLDNAALKDLLKKNRMATSDSKRLSS